ncbi:hypothetical protein [Tenacibaculum mesophilum]|uniref:hypothetical protein n=1 Tax=Tenacibaculum mesophilum TaxID=104268 RepID=UPI00248F874F|nr:hypothetical protein [Tenacibaculum mesophilum]
MKKTYIFLIIGVLIGTLLTLGVTKFNVLTGNNLEKKREAIAYAKKLLEDKYSNEKTSLVFPPISKIKVDFTDVNTYVVKLRTTYKEGRWIKYKGGYVRRYKDFFIVEVKNQNEKWHLIEMKNSSTYY